LEIKGRKLGGYGSYTIGDARTFYGFYQLKEPDLALAGKVLRTPPEKVMDKVTKTAAERMAYHEEAVGREVPWEELDEVLKKAVVEHFNIKLVPGELIDEERRRTEELAALLTSEEWGRANTDDRKLGPMPPGAERREGITKVTGGPALRIVAYINPKENRIINVSITGSMHCDPRPMPFWLEGALKGVLIDENTIRTKVEELFSIGTVAAATADDYVKAIMGAVAR
jgi:hypothetical protein